MALRAARAQEGCRLNLASARGPGLQRVVAPGPAENFTHARVPEHATAAGPRAGERSSLALAGPRETRREAERTSRTHVSTIAVTGGASATPRSKGGRPAAPAPACEKRRHTTSRQAHDDSSRRRSRRRRACRRPISLRPLRQRRDGRGIARRDRRGGRGGGPVVRSTGNGASGAGISHLASLRRHAQARGCPTAARPRLALGPAPPPPPPPPPHRRKRAAPKPVLTPSCAR